MALDYRKRLERNIPIFYIYRFFSAMFFVMPVFYLFLLENGLSMTEIGILQSYYITIYLVLSIPAGALADKIGKKQLIIASNILYVLATFIYYKSNSFWGFFAAETMFGISIAAWFGIGEAFIYDTLKGLGKERKYKRVWGTAVAIQSVMFGAVSIAGAYMAKHSLTLPFKATMITAGVGCIVAFFFTEPKIKKQTTSYFKHIKSAIIYAVSHPKIRLFLLYTATMGGVCLALFVLLQPYLKDISLNIEHFGFVYAILFGFGALGAKFAHTIEKKLGVKKILLLMLVPCIIGAFLVGSFKSVIIGTIAFAIVQFVFGLSAPVITNYINHHTESSIRSTMLALNTWGSQLVAAITIPFFGYMADKISIGSAFMTAGIIFSLNFLFLIALFSRKSS